MPRGARLDSPGTLHHVMVRGIEGRRIIEDDKDREKFMSRTGELVLDTGTSMYAWVLMDNHAHFLLKSGNHGLSGFMQRLLSAYATYFNRRHRREGHLFQNRYKSIVCEEDGYFTELVRYIHLNPLRAGILDSLSQLDKYQWCGHAGVMNYRKNNWQNREYVLSWFGEREGGAREAYRRFIEKGLVPGKQPDLNGGGLIRSMGGWSVVKSLRKKGDRIKGDERILGSADFVSGLLAEADEKIRFQFSEPDLEKEMYAEIISVCQQEKVSVKELQSGSRRNPLPFVRRELAIKLVTEYGISLAETARQLGISTSGVAQIMRRNR